MKKIRTFFKNKFLSAAAGALCALAFAPINFFPLAIISLSVFYFLLEEENKNLRVFFCGFGFGFGYFLIGNYWIAISLLVDAKFFWLIPFALTLIPAALALYPAMFAVSYKFFIKKFSFHTTYQKIIIFALAWLLFEILRSNLFTGFPWNLLGYIWMFNLPSSQSASLFGIYGLSFFAVFVCLFPVLFLQKFHKKLPSEIAVGDKIMAVLIVIFVVINFSYGMWRIDDKKIITDSGTLLRLVQGNIKQNIKWAPVQKYQNFLKHVQLTKSRDLSPIKAVIWSETSVPYVIDDSPELLYNLLQATPQDGNLITGALRVLYEKNKKENLADIWNSIFLLDEKGVTSAYDKHHLVPFGEYVPLQKFFPFIEKITDGAVGFSEGKGPQTLHTKAFSFSPLVCYEAIFSDETVDKKSRPDLLVNLTNDAWFGVSSGPYQHFNMARMRSIEYGIAMARVANTGVTAFVDPFGRVVKKIGLNQSGIIDVALIKPLEPTVYARYGNAVLSAIVALLVLFLFLITITNKLFSKKNVAR